VEAQAVALVAHMPAPQVVLGRVAEMAMPWAATQEA